MSSSKRETKGILARMANEIALYNIVIIDVITCAPEVIFYVKQEDILKTHEILFNLNK